MSQHPPPHSEPRPFKAKIAGQCADGSFIYDWCHGIRPGDIIVKRPIPAKFDRPGKEGYYELWYSHLRCYEERMKEPEPRLLP